MTSGANVVKLVGRDAVMDKLVYAP